MLSMRNSTAVIRSRPTWSRNHSVGLPAVGRDRRVAPTPQLMLDRLDIIKKPSTTAHCGLQVMQGPRDCGRGGFSRMVVLLLLHCQICIAESQFLNRYRQKRCSHAGNWIDSSARNLS